MNYIEFIKSLEESNFEKLGKSCAFNKSQGWIIGFIGLSGKFQQKESKAFVICARPEKFEYMEVPKNKYSTSPLEYPIKLTFGSFNTNLKYQSQLLNYDYSRIGTESDWTELLRIFVYDLPLALNNLGVAGLESQLREIEDLGFIEKVWLGEQNA